MSTATVPVERRLRLPRPRIDWGIAVTTLLLATLVVVDLSLQPALADITQIGLLVQTALPLLFVAAAQTLAVLVRGIDLSVGGVFAVANTMTAVWVGAAGGNHQLLLLAVLVAGLAMGAINGVLIAGLGFQPFIATLGTWTAYGGVALMILPSDGGAVPLVLTSILNGTVAGIPASIVIVAVLLLAWRVLRTSRFGTQIYAVGDDEERARLNGTPVRRVRLLVYALAGLCAAVGGIMLAGATSTGSPTAGDPYILMSLSAVVIGGTSLRGGAGGVGLSVMAAFSLILISDIASAMNLDVWVSVAASALLLLVMVTARALVERRAEGRTP
ncbi:Ribose ABC transport system permease protein RbsC (TC 3.A.1.2.1) [Patulibacter medicamentivorans]|uniref:Ribose ABC transport system permease protein RbsC (TC 3.A.1.2.1) n=1 Tax=Patulibacter medicamentivorans TaxID=1097667 RepID=H0E721_9ACTN|nr:ABC transporter permease [Patulibacter medicamentivorans]EHN10516.1 Ribose ABC transport system permease protein RbsC (TC 3.A.1.2.1) [Patulibacter medicamentivorans]